MVADCCGKSVFVRVPVPVWVPVVGTVVCLVWVPVPLPVPPPVPLPPWPPCAMRSSSAVSVRMLCRRRASLLGLVFITSPHCCRRGPVWAALIRRSTNRAKPGHSLEKFFGVEIDVSVLLTRLEILRASVNLGEAPRLGPGNLGTGRPCDLAGVIAVHKAQEDELMSACGRTQQPDGVQVVEAVQQRRERLGQLTPPGPVRQLTEQRHENF